MKITSIGKTPSSQPPSESPRKQKVKTQAVRYAAFTALAAVAPVKSIGAGAPAGDPAAEMQVLADFAQIDMLMRTNPSDPRIAQLWTEIQSLQSKCPDLQDYFTGDHALNSSLSADDFRTRFVWHMLPTEGGGFVLMQDLIKNEPRDAGVLTDFLMNVILVAADISSVRGAGSYMDDLIWGFSQIDPPIGNIAQNLGDFLNAYFYEKNLKNGVEDWNGYESSYQSFMKMLPSSDSSGLNQGIADLKKNHDELYALKDWDAYSQQYNKFSEPTDYFRMINQLLQGWENKDLYPH